MGARIVPATLEVVPERLGEASFLIERLGTQRLAAGGCTREMLESRHPRLIHVSVTTFGSDGPRADWVGSELVASAMGGSLVLTGEPDGVPVKEALDACFFHADMVAAAGAMAAHYERGTSGLGQHVDISAQEVALSRGVNGMLVWQFDRRKLHRAGGALNYGQAKVRCIWRLADGWCFHTLMTGRFGAPANQALSDWMDECGLDNPLRGVDWIRYNRSTLDPRVAHSLGSGDRGFLPDAQQGRDRAPKAVGVASTPAVSGEPADVLADPHLSAREFWAHDRWRASAEPVFRRDASGGTWRGRGHRARPGERDVTRAASRPAGRHPRVGFLLGAGGLDHHQDPRRPRRRCHQGREPHAALSVTDGRAGDGFACRQFR